MISAAMDFWMITFRNFEGPSASCGESQFCSKNTPVGIDVPTTARGWNLAYGLFSVGETEGVQGGTEGNISPVGCPPKAEMTRSSGKQQAERTAVRAAPIVCPEESPLLAAIGDNFAVSKSPRRGRRACSPMGRAIASVGDPKGVQGGERKAPLLAPQRENSAEEISLMGPDAPTPAREEGLQPYGALTLFFRWRKKSVQKKASGTATPGKRLLLPILTAGLAMSRAMELDSYYTGAERARARLSPPSK